MLIMLITGNVAKNVNKYEANHTGNIVLYCSDLKLWICLQPTLKRFLSRIFRQNEVFSGIVALKQPFMGRSHSITATFGVRSCFCPLGMETV